MFFFHRGDESEIELSRMPEKRARSRKRKWWAMWEWSDKLKLGKSSVFVKRDLRALPLTDAEFEADFFLDPGSSTRHQERWMGAVIEREFGGLLAMEDVRTPPPTVNRLANLLAHAMLRPLDEGDRQRPSTIHLRDRPQWQELVPHLRQLGIEVALVEDLPRFDEAVFDWMQRTKGKKPCSVDEIKTALRKPFPERRRSWLTDALDLMEWADAMFKGAYPSRENAVPLYGPETVVPIHLAAEELDAILTQTRIARTKKLRPRLEAMAAEGRASELDINDGSGVVLALCGAKVGKQSAHKRMLKIGRRIADHLAETLGIDGPALRT